MNNSGKMGQLNKKLSVNVCVFSVLYCTTVVHSHKHTRIL